MAKRKTLRFMVDMDLANWMEAIRAKTGLSISDSDAGSGTMMVTLAVASGSLGAVSGGGVSVSGAGTGTLTLSGTLATKCLRKRARPEELSTRERFGSVPIRSVL